MFYQKWLDQKDGDDWQSSKILGEIRSYNKEDCDSTWQLADWLRRVQKEYGIQWLQKELKAAPQSAAADFRNRAAELAARMLDGIPVDPASKTELLRLRELLAYLLEFHWREAKPVFWAKYDRHEMTEQELFDDPGCLAALQRDQHPPRPVARSFYYDYSFDANQDTKIDVEDSCFFAHDLREKITVAEIDPDNGHVALKRIKTGPPPRRINLASSRMNTLMPAQSPNLFFGPLTHGWAGTRFRLQSKIFSLDESQECEGWNTVRLWNQEMI